MLSHERQCISMRYIERAVFGGVTSHRSPGVLWATGSTGFVHSRLSSTANRLFRWPTQSRLLKPTEAAQLLPQECWKSGPGLQKDEREYFRM